MQQTRTKRSGRLWSELRNAHADSALVVQLLRLFKQLGQEPVQLVPVSAAETVHQPVLIAQSQGRHLSGHMRTCGLVSLRNASFRENPFNTGQMMRSAGAVDIRYNQGDCPQSIPPPQTAIDSSTNLRI